MADFTKEELGALRALSSLAGRCEKAREKQTLGASRQALLKNRIRALRIAAALIQEKLDGRE